VLAKLSSKGQVVIPRAVRQALRLQPGMQLEIKIVDGTIILQPLGAKVVSTLYGRYPDVDFLKDLEDEHRREVASDPPIRP